MTQAPFPPPDAETTPPDPASDEFSYHLIGRRAEQQQEGLFKVSLGLLAVAAVYYGATAQVEDTLHLYLGLAILVLSVLPASFWLKRGGSRFPIFEPLMMLCGPAYALPLLTGHEQTALYPPETLTLAGLSVLAYQVAAIVAYTFTRGLPGRSGFWVDAVITRDLERLVSYGLVLSTTYIGISVFTTWIPRELESVLRAIFYGVSILCTFITSQRWGRDELKPQEKVLFGLMILLQQVFMCTSLLLIGAFSQLGIALLGFLSSGRRIPWLAIVSAFLILAVLHNGKAQMRTLYWEQQRPPPGITELPAFFTEWFRFGLQTPVIGGGKEAASSKLLERTSLFHILCLVAYQSPDRQPYLMGETYGYVPPQFVPRFFWSDKPRSHIATYRLSIYYGLQDEDATQTTTIAFGMLAEAYANLGLVGCILLGLVQGAFFKKLQAWSAHSPLLSLAGLMMILMTAWACNSEMTMAAWVSSLFQALVVVLGIPLLLRGLFAP